MIRYLHRKDIDTQRWDELIRRSPYATFYAFSWYLDAAAENWSALIEDDYHFIMPFTWKKKLGIHYLYQPLFTQQLGVFGEDTVPPDVVRNFLFAIPKKFRFGDQQFNTGNLLGEEESFEVNDRLNYELQTGAGYHELYRAYSENNRRNLKKACAAGMEVRFDTSISEIVHFKKTLAEARLPDEHYLRIRDLFTTLGKHEKILVISTHLEGKLCAAALFGFSGNRAVYLYSASTEEGKEARAMFLIIDQFIRENDNRNLILDFEGSNIPSIARFFAGFGAKPSVYQQIRFDNMPLGIRKLRRNG